MRDGTYKTWDGRTVTVRNTPKSVMVTDHVSGETVVLPRAQFLD